MLTTRKRKVAKLIGESRSMKEAMIKANYALSTASKGQACLSKDEEFLALLEKELADSKVVRTHTEALGATRIHTSHTEPDRIVPDWPTRVKAVDLAYKVKGKLIEKKELTGKDGGKIEIEITPGAVRDISGQPPIQDSSGGQTLREDDFITG